MKSDTLRYNSISEIAYFFGPTTIQVKNEGTLIYCENGWYDTKNDISQFDKNAFLHSKEHTIRGDSLFYDKNKGYGQAFKNITATDTVENIIINGDYAEFFEENEITIITGNAMLTQVYDEDSLFLHADTLKAGDRSASTSNRNFEGRMGERGSRVFLVSTLTAAASALEGATWPGGNGGAEGGIGRDTARHEHKRHECPT